jgi:hypothetical protein
MESSQMSNLNIDKDKLTAAIERARAIVAARTLAKNPVVEMPPPTPTHAPMMQQTHGIVLNEKQQTAVDYTYFGKKFCLIGAAGTGKTTAMRACIRSLIENHRVPILLRGTNNLLAGMPGIAVISYTRRAVRNIAKNLPAEIRSHCMTYHALMEYAPEYIDVMGANGEYYQSMRFLPTYHAGNKLPAGLRCIVIEEASLLSTDYFKQLWDALPDPHSVQFITLGDLHQLPPVYGLPILGKHLTEFQTIELTDVYRQALKSPIISVAHAIKNGGDFSAIYSSIKDGDYKVTSSIDVRNLKFDNLPGGITKLDAGEHGSVTFHVWKKRLDNEDSLEIIQAHLCRMIEAGQHDPDTDLILCPWNKKETFGCTELNLAVADYLGKKRNAKVFEIIAGYDKRYFAVGDRIIADKQDAIILDISPSPRYLGKSPQQASEKMNRWGHGGVGVNAFDENISDEQIEFLLSHASGVEDKTNAASHTIRVKLLDTDVEKTLTTTGEINACDFGYATTVHKSQGSEARRIVFVSHYCHAAMMSRELVYTGVTRAAEHLYFICTPMALMKAAKKPRLKGNTLAEKIAFFNTRFAEKEAEETAEGDNE